MSSAILYVAIVAIWIGVLVPRWLKHEHSYSSQTGLGRLSRHFGGTRPGDGPEARAGFDPDGRPRYTSFVPPETPSGSGPEGAPGGAPGPQTHAPASNSESQFNYGEKVSSVASGNKNSMTEFGQAQVPRSTAPSSGEIPSYGWSADEAARQERPGTIASDGEGTSAPPAPDAHQAQGTEARHGAAGAGAGVRVPAPRSPHHHDEAGDAERRAQIVRGRRRMLWLLLVLTAVGVGLAYLQLAAWWVMIPPTVLLAGYLLLLREAAHADAEARQRRELAHATAQAHHTPEAAARPGARGEATPRGEAAPAPAASASPPAAPAGSEGPSAAPAGSEGPATTEETGPRADIINLSEHVGDQFYDQYADAKLRAVGD